MDPVEALASRLEQAQFSSDAIAVCRAEDIAADTLGILTGDLLRTMGFPTNEIVGLQCFAARYSPIVQAKSQEEKEEAPCGTTTLEGLEDAIAQQGRVVRDMKAEANCDKTTLGAAVSRLLDLKNRLPEGHSLRPKEKSEKKQAQKAEKQKKAQERAALQHKRSQQLKKRAEEINFPLIQRKIYHALEPVGTGDQFRYTLNINERNVPVGKAFYCTEKWDGTTVQATCEGVFKRYDNFAKGSRKKRKATVGDRYRLELLDLENAANKHIADAIKPYMDIFKNLPDGLCCYFEAIHSEIGGTYQRVQGGQFCDIRLFDFSRDGEFLPFEETQKLAAELALPCVAAVQYDATSPELFVRIAKEAKGSTYCDVDAPLEGYVLRGTGTEGWIAKLRQEYLR